MTEQLTEQPPTEQDAPAPVSGPVRVSWATVPRVNLLPLEILQRRRLRRTKTLLGIMVFAGIVIAAAGVFLAQREVNNARDDLTVAQSQVTVLNADAAKYSAVPAVVAQVEAASAARTDVMSRDIPWYQFMEPFHRGSASRRCRWRSPRRPARPAAERQLTRSRQLEWAR